MAVSERKSDLGLKIAINVVVYLGLGSLLVALFLAVMAAVE